MIRPGFLDSESRRDLIELARDGSAAHRLARRANALVLLDKGMSCQSVAEVLLLDGDTIRSWYQLYQQDGIEGLASFGLYGGGRTVGDALRRMRCSGACGDPRRRGVAGDEASVEHLRQTAPGGDVGAGGGGRDGQ